MDYKHSIVLNQKRISCGPLFRVKDTKVKIFDCIPSGEDGEEKG